MTLYDFIIEQTKLVGEFADFWHRNCKADLPNFPMTMAAGEWDEQFRLFMELRRIG